VRIVKAAVAVLLIAVLVGVLAFTGLAVWVTVRAFPQTSGTASLPGLSGNVTVVRDAIGIAHITADTTHDLFAAQGYVHASERMWQMEVWRHISAGRLAEMFGASQLDTDKFIRTLGWRVSAQRDLDAVGPEARAILDAYTEGVNVWLDGHRGSLGLAFLASGVTPERWTNLDTVAWGKVQAWNLGGNFDSEVFRYLADSKLGDPARTDDLFPPYREDGPVITPTGLPGSGGAGAQGPAASRASVTADTQPATPRPIGPAEAAAWRSIAGLGQALLQTAGLDAAEGLASDHGIGSNDWVVGPGMSGTGGALLANDPHLGISMPSIWFINGLHCRTVSDACPYDVAGVSFPGVPGVVLGHNARIAWGATNIDPDVQDLVIEKVDPANPDSYMHDGASTPFDVRHEEIKVAGKASFDLEIRSTVHGPILNEVDERLKDAPPMAIRWTANLEPDRTLEAILGLNTAASFQDFRESLSLYGAPAQNFVYADVDGHIGYQFPGYVPIRSDPADHGARPVRGDDGSGEWTGRIPFDDLPWQLDPEDGVIVTANNAAVDASYPYFVAQEWDPGFRAERILDQIGLYADDGLTVDEMRKIQYDAAPLAPRDIIPLLEAGKPTTDDGKTIATRIGDWDGTCDQSSLGCAAWNGFQYRVLRDIFDDDLDTLARDYVGSPFSWVHLRQLLEDPTSTWWDDSRTAGVTETSDAIVARAMDEAGAELRGAFGAPDGWTWGRLHSATFREATLGTSGIRPLEWYFNDGPHAVPGTAGAVNNTYFRFSSAYPDPTDPDYVPVGIDHVFDMTNMPSYRLTIDLHDLDGARLIITTGQSGNPFDSHYNDQITSWIGGETVALPFTPGAISAAAVSTLTLTP
jgi:penicillin amidase